MEKSNKIYDGMMGLVVGDALGVPFEFKKRDTFTVTDMVGFGTYNLPAGTWSDDSSMALATLDSLVQKGKLDTKDMMERFLSWWLDASYTPYGEVFDIGNTTMRALYHYSQNRKVKTCGGRSVRDNGNGSLMRILPLVFTPYTGADVYAVSSLTHAHEISVLSCVYYLDVADKLLRGWKKDAAVHSLDDCEGVFVRLPNIDRYARDTILSSGYVLDTLEAAFWCLLTTESYRDCVITAVELGSDTDTVAAVAGGLAGIYYGVGGEKGIPTEWIDKIARKEWIEELTEKANAIFTNG